MSNVSTFGGNTEKHAHWAAALLQARHGERMPPKIPAARLDGGKRFSIEARGVRLCVLGGVCVSGLLLRMCPTAGIVLREMTWRCGGTASGFCTTVVPVYSLLCVRRGGTVFHVSGRGGYFGKTGVSRAFGREWRRRRDVDDIQLS